MVGISKRNSYLRYIFKIHSARLRKAKWDLTLPVSKARENNEVIALSGSTILRFIDELNGLNNPDARIIEIRRKIAAVKRDENSSRNRRDLKLLYDELESITFKHDYMSLVIDKESDYWRACKGFKINGVEYVRLLGTNGGIKNSTIVFVSKRLYPELKRRIDNGRDMTKELVPAKLEAYQALVCSGSDPVSMPNGVVVVDDCITHFKADVLMLDDAEDGEPKMEYVEGADIELDESDGYGIMLPSLAERWSKDLNLSYTIGAATTRNSWEKGMVFTFDFLDFADKVVGSRTVTDAWGDTVDLGEVELVLTTSMVKLWDSYTSCDDYLRNCEENGYTFSVTKVAPEKLENERMTNYQFLQVFNLTDEQIDELIQPTIQEFHDILRFDWRKMALFLNGTSFDEDDLLTNKLNYPESIMVDARLAKDPFIIKRTKEMMSKKIQDAKIGVVKVHGNYSIICGDPYALCQSMFGLEITGLLNAGEIYNQYWVDAGVSEVACFRAPMSTHENVRKMKISQSDDAKYWFRYIPACTMLNAWDTTTHALNGADKDGDLVMLTDNSIILNAIEDRPTLMCAQRKAKKIVPTEEDIIKSNIASFGDDIGKITNRVTAMFEIQSKYPKNSREFKALDYRIKAGQLFQQNAIDKAKGIISKPMPRYWYDRVAIWHDETMTDDEKEFQTSIVADKKPYFMRYIYPSVAKAWKRYDQGVRSKCTSVFGKSLNTLLSNLGELDADEKEFVENYYRYMPVGIGDCVMNRICRRFEEEFDNYMKKYKPGDGFDYTIMKSGAHYTDVQKRAVKKLFDEYTECVTDYMKMVSVERISYEDKIVARHNLVHRFRRAAYNVCSNRYQLCDIVLDVTYLKEGSKQFAWDVVADVIFENLARKNNNIIYLPELSSEGDVKFNGDTYIFVPYKLEEDFYEYNIKREAIC